MRACVEPGHAAAHDDDFQFTASQIGFVHIGDLELATRAWLKRLSNLYDLVVVKIESGHGVARFWLLRFFFNAKRTPIRVELYYSIPLGIMHRIGEDARSTALCSRLAKVLR